MNTPLTRAQVKALPTQKWTFYDDFRGGKKLTILFGGFTATSDGMNGRMRRFRPVSDINNRKTTRGRVRQFVAKTVPMRTSFGIVFAPTESMKVIAHKKFFR